MKHPCPRSFKLLFAVLAVFLSANAKQSYAESPRKTDVFVSGKGGYHTYRIPALIITKKGTLLAFCEGRKSSRSDHGDVYLVKNRSDAGGRNWWSMQLVEERGGDEVITIGNA